MLQQMQELLANQPALARPLRLALEGEPLAKPAGHRGGAGTDMFRLDLDAAAVGAIIQAVDQAVAQGAATSGTEGRGLGGFAEAWRELDQFINLKQEEEKGHE